MRSPRQVTWLCFAAVTLGCMSSVALAIVTSDGFGTHVIQNGTPLDLDDILPFNSPALNHDTVAQLRILRPDYGEILCSSALINTPLGPGTLAAAHCLADDHGQLIATDASVFYEEFGIPIEYTTSDPQNMLIHPNYDGTGWHGYDIAVVFWDQPIGATVQPRYDLSNNEQPPLFLPVVKMGFGWTGHGNGEQDLIQDDQKRWGLNRYEALALGDCGVPVPGGWNNTETQLSMDFDSGLEENDVFSTYCYGEGEVKTFYLGFGPDEVLGAFNDSGGPNFVYDGNKWVIGAVNSYVFRIPDGVLGVPESTDVNDDFDFSWGEYEGDARVTVDLVNQVLGLVPPTKSSGGPFGHGWAAGGHLFRPESP